MFSAALCQKNTKTILVYSLNFVQEIANFVQRLKTVQAARGIWLQLPCVKKTDYCRLFLEFCTILHTKLPILYRVVEGDILKINQATGGMWLQLPYTKKYNEYSCLFLELCTIFCEKARILYRVVENNILKINHEVGVMWLQHLYTNITIFPVCSYNFV